MDLVRFCLIGAGRAGLIHARNIAQRIPQASLVGVCDASAQTAAEVADELGVAERYTDFHEAIDRGGADAVVIVTPTFLHREIACAAAEKGMHVFLEKPMALTVQECRAINQSVERAGVKLQIGFMRRFDEGFQRAKDLLDSGRMGRVMIVKSTGRGPGGPGPWMWDLKKSNGIVAEVNSHDIDSLHWFAGGEVERIYAEAHNFKMEEARREFPDFYDNFVATFRFDNDTIGSVDGTCPAHYGYDARVEILCEKGVIFIGSAKEQGMEFITVESGLGGDAVKSWRNLFKDAYLAEMQHFVDCVLHDRAPAVTGQDGLNAVAGVVGVNRSLAQRRPIHLPTEVLA